MAKFLNKDPFTYHEEQKEFLKELERFHASRGTPFTRIPRVGGKDVDLFALYRRVINFGGWRKVNDEDVWEQFSSDFHLPKGCSNATQALKHIYVRYLDKYEKVHFHGEDPDRKDHEEDGETPRKKICLPIYGIPLSYNYSQHRVSESARQAFNFSTDFASFSDYDKLEKALMSGLPNEVDFVINVCTLLSNEGKHVLQLNKTKNLLDLLMAHVGVFNDGPGGLEDVYQSGWKNFLKRDFIRFWFDTVKNHKMKELIYTTRDYHEKSLVGSEVLNLGRDLGKHDLEGQRILQLSIILRNLSFEENNARVMCKNSLVSRFLMLCAHSSYSSLRALALDTFCNLAEKMVLCLKDKDSEMVLDMISRCLAGDDKLDAVRGLEMLSKLCQTDANDIILEEKLDDRIYEDIIRLLGVYDIQIIVHSLEALYQLSEIGEHTATKIAAVKCAVDFLVTLLTIEAQSFGPNSLVGIKVVEYCPPPPRVDTSVPAVPQTPATAQKTPQQPGQTKSTVTAAPPNCDVESTTCNWLQSVYEYKEGGVSLSQLQLYTDYINFSKKYSLPQLLPAQAFLNCVRTVFTKIEVQRTGKDDGSQEVFYKGLVKRTNPLPFAIHCNTGGAAAAGGGGNASAIMPSSSSSSSSSSQSLSSSGQDQAKSAQHSIVQQPLKTIQPATSLSISGPSSISPSPSSGAQASRLSTAPPVSNSNITQPAGQNVPVFIIQQVYQNDGKLVETHDPRHPSDTKMIKTLLAKKLRHNQTGPVPICPKLDPSTNPMQLLTFTTQQGTVIQEQLQQPYMVSQAIIPQQPTQFIQQPYDQFSQGQIQVTMPAVENVQYSMSPMPSPASSVCSAMSSQSLSHQSQQPTKPEKSKKKKGSRSSSPKRSNSPKGKSPINSPPSPTDNSGHDQDRDLEVCGEVERAKDIVKVGQEARIERVENKCLDNIKSVPNDVSTTIPSNIDPSVIQSNDLCNKLLVSDTGQIQNINFVPSGSVVQADQTGSLGQITNCVGINMGNVTNVYPSVLDLAVSAAGIGEDSMSSTDLDQNSVNLNQDMTPYTQTDNYLSEQNAENFTAESEGIAGGVEPDNASSNHLQTETTALQEQNGICDVTIETKPQQEDEVVNNCDSLVSENGGHVKSADECCEPTVLNVKEETQIDISHDIEMSTNKSDECTLKCEIKSEIGDVVGENDSDQQSVLQVDPVGATSSDMDVDIKENSFNEDDLKASSDQNTFAANSISDCTATHNGQESHNNGTNFNLNDATGVPLIHESNELYSDSNFNLNNASSGQLTSETNELNNDSDFKLNDTSTGQLISESNESPNNLVNSYENINKIEKSTSVHPPLVNGGSEFQEEEDMDEIIPSPTQYKMNGIFPNEDSCSKEDMDLHKSTQLKCSLNKLGEKLGKVNGVINHIGNGEHFEDNNGIDYEMMDQLEGNEERLLQPKKEEVENDVQHVLIHAGDGDSVVVVDSQGRIEINGKVTDVGQLTATENIDNSEQDLAVASILGEAPSQESETSEQYVTAETGCYELAGEPDDMEGQNMEDNEENTEAKVFPSQESEDTNEVLIENEMCLKPSPCSLPNAVDMAVAELMEGVSPTMDLEDSMPQDMIIPTQQIVTTKDGFPILPKVLDSSGGIINQPVMVTTNFTSNQINLGNNIQFSNIQQPIISQQMIGQPMVGPTFFGQPLIGQPLVSAPGPVVQIKSVKDLIISNESAIKMGLKPDQILINRSDNNMLVSNANFCAAPSSNVATSNFYTITQEDSEKSKCQSMEVCTSRHVPTPEASRDSELSCDSIASSLTDSSSQDKHSASTFIQGIQVVTTMAVTVKSAPVLTTTATSVSGSSGSSKKSRTKSGDKKPKKRNRNTSGSADSRTSTSSSTTTATHAPEYMCDWINCKRCFENSKTVFYHVCTTHLSKESEGFCLWDGCEKLKRKRWSLVTHIQDHHCSELALKAAALRRQQAAAQQAGTGSTPPTKPHTIPALVYPPDAAWQAIRRFTPKPPYPEFTEQREGPVTKHIRLTAALVLRNLARYSSLGRSMIKRHERHINYTAMSALESSNSLANCLWEVLHDH